MSYRIPMAAPRIIRQFAGSMVVLSLLVGTAGAASPDDAYRRMLEGNSSTEGDQAPKPNAKPKPVRTAKPPPPKAACDRRFAELKVKVDAGDAWYKQKCFHDEKCSQSERCEYVRRLGATFIAMAQAATNCSEIPDSKEVANKYQQSARNNKSLEKSICNSQDR